MRIDLVRRPFTLAGCMIQEAAFDERGARPSHKVYEP